jgi:hypothetical protein
MKKDLFKPGRPVHEYVDSDGNLKVNCMTCKFRKSIKDCRAGDWLCVTEEKFIDCNHEDGLFHGKYHGKYLLWEPRFEGMIKNEDFEI